MTYSLIRITATSTGLWMILILAQRKRKRVEMRNKLSEFYANPTGPNVGDSKIYASDIEAPLFEAEQIPFELHHKIEKAIRTAELNAASMAKSKVIKQIEQMRIYE